MDSDLHARLLAELNKPWEIWAPSNAAAPLGRQRLALLTVVDRHAPKPCRGFPCLHLDPHLRCPLCGQDDPCDELRTIADQLGLV